MTAAGQGQAPAVSAADAGSELAYSWPEVVSALLRRSDLPPDATSWAMNEIMSGEATSAQIAAFVVALRAKGETVDEVVGLVDAMYEHATTIAVPGRTLDVVGTGGDRAHTVNISTMAALVAAGSGATVVKHGNRAASSACGSADLLEELGVVLDLSPAQVAEVAGEVGITFCFAPLFHPALRHAAGPRREIGVATTFNFLGPLANPAHPPAAAVGVADERMAGILAGVLGRRDVSALVFHGDDGLDELTTTTTSRVWLVHRGGVAESSLDPARLGVPRHDPAELRGGSPAVNAGIARAFLAGDDGAVRDTVMLNAAAALVAYDLADRGSEAGQLDATAAATELPQLLRRGLARAAASVDTGSAAGALDRWVEASRKRRPSERRISALLEGLVITAIVLVKAQVDRIPDVAEAIAELDSVSEVYSVTGEFDLIAMVRVRRHDDLADVIPGRINKINGIQSTETHVAFRTYSHHDLEAAFALGVTEAD